MEGKGGKKRTEQIPKCKINKLIKQEHFKTLCMNRLKYLK